MSVVIPKNTPIPTQKTRGFTTVNDNQTSVLFQVLEGERVNLADLNILGKFTLKDLPPAPSGALDIQVTFDIDYNGILNVSAIDKSSGSKGEVKITNDRNKPTP